MSKNIEKDKSLLEDALAEYNAIKEEAIKVAKNRLAESMPDVIENYLKDELEKTLNESFEDEMSDEGVISTEDTMIDDQDSSIVDTMKGVDSPVTEEADMDDELTAAAIEEALNEIDMEDGGDDMFDDLEGIDEHDLSLELSFDDDKLELTDIVVDDEEMDDVEYDLDFGDEDEEEDVELEIVDDESDEFESEEEISADDIDLDSLGDEDEEDVEESLAHTITHDNAKKAGSHNHTNYEKESRLRPGVKTESKFKADIDKLIKENDELKSINLQFKDALNKYKTQLYEMAVFNANLSHVNNLFVEHSTTVDEKKEILSKFKSVSTIEESKTVYGDFVKTLNESKNKKKTIEEMVEKPVNGDSASQKINESLGTQKEVDGVKAIKYMMNYIENRRK